MTYVKHPFFFLSQLQPYLPQGGYFNPLVIFGLFCFLSEFSSKRFGESFHKLQSLKVAHRFYIGIFFSQSFSPCQLRLTVQCQLRKDFTTLYQSSPAVTQTHTPCAFRRQYRVSGVDSTGVYLHRVSQFCEVLQWES